MRDINGHIVEHEYIVLDCGNVAEFDDGSGCAYRCTNCGTIVGSVSEPARCVAIRKEKEDKAEVWKVLSS
jgi:hypothetical protein